MTVSWSPTAFYTENRRGMMPVFQQSRIPGVRNRPVMADPVNAALMVPIIDEVGFGGPNAGYVQNFDEDLALWRGLRQTWRDCETDAYIAVGQIQNPGTGEYEAIYPPGREADINDVGRVGQLGQDYDAERLDGFIGTSLEALTLRIALLGSLRVIHAYVFVMIDNSGSTLWEDHIDRVRETIALREYPFRANRFLIIESMDVDDGSWASELWLDESSTQLARFIPCREVANGGG